MTETQYLLQSLAQGPYKKKSYESDLSQLPEKYRPKYNSDPTLSALAGGFIGDWPGAKLRNTGENGTYKYDFYNPFSRDAVPNKFASPEEELDYNMSHAAGELGGIATAVPGAVKFAGRKLLSALAGRNLVGARGEAANAARWMDPSVLPKSGNPAILGEEAAQAANEAGSKVINASRAVEEAGQFGERLNPAIQASRRLLTAKAAGAGVDALLGGARNSIEAEDDANFSVPNVDQNTDHPDFAPTSSSTASSPAADYTSVMAGRKPLTPYQPHDSVWAKIIDAILPQYGQERHLENERAYLGNQMMEKGYLDPETKARMEDIQLDKAGGRTAALQQSGSDQQLRNILAPTMSTGTLEDILRSPSGSIDPKRLDRMTRQGDPIAMLRELFPNGLGGGMGGPGMIQAQPVVNVPRQVNRVPTRR